MPVPCNCCPVADSNCFEASAQVPFVTAAVSANPGGLSIVNLASTIDGTAGADLSGFSPPVTAAQLAANPTTAIDWGFAAPTPINRVRWFNGGGGVLTDQDGFGVIQLQLLDNALTILYQTSWDLGPPIGNNNLVREIVFPEVPGVRYVRATNMNKQNNAVMGTGSPLLRQIQAFQTAAKPVWRCRNQTPPNTMRWFDSVGTEYDSSLVMPCD